MHSRSHRPKWRRARKCSVYTHALLVFVSVVLIVSILDNDVAPLDIQIDGLRYRPSAVWFLAPTLVWSTIINWVRHESARWLELVTTAPVMVALAINLGGVSDLQAMIAVPVFIHMAIVLCCVSEQHPDPSGRTMLIWVTVLLTIFTVWYYLTSTALSKFLQQLPAVLLITLYGLVLPCVLIRKYCCRSEQDEYAAISRVDDDENGNVFVLVQSSASDDDDDDDANVDDNAATKPRIVRVSKYNDMNYDRMVGDILTLFGVLVDSVMTGYFVCISIAYAIVTTP